MDHFNRRNDNLYAEGVNLEEIAAEFGTPTYVYSQTSITENVAAFKDALGSLDYLICYSVKTNSNLAILQLMRRLGCGFDAVSSGELHRVLKAGGQASQTTFSGVGKTDAEIAQALAAGVHSICVESEAEMWAVRDIAVARGHGPAPISMRINPDVDAHTHPYIATGLKENKFGVAIAAAPSLLAAAAADSHLTVVGISCHIGSQITTLAPFVDAAQRMAALVRELTDAGIRIAHVCVGGGLGIRYNDEEPPSAAAYGRVLAETLGPLGVRILLEPGRVLVGKAGVLLSQVVRTKTQESRQFAVLDAAMNDFIRPALYGAYHGVEAVRGTAVARKPWQLQDVVGPVCESADMFAKDRLLPPLNAGDLVVLRDTGAYGFGMSSNYNGRLRPAEVMVIDDKVYLIRQRQSVADIWRGEIDIEGRAFDDT